MEKIIHATLLLTLGILWGYGIGHYFPTAGVIGGGLSLIGAGIVSCAAMGDGFAELELDNAIEEL